MANYNLSKNTIRVGNGSWVVSTRVVGVFSIKIKSIGRLSKKFLNADKLVDVTGRNAAKSLVILDDNSGILSPFEVSTIVKNLGMKEVDDS